MSESGGRAAEQAAFFVQKRKVTDHVRARFARFGDEALSIVLGYALQPKRMPGLLQRVGLKISGDLEAQLESIWEFIAESGAHEFIKRAKQLRLEEIEAADIDALEGRPFNPRGTVAPVAAETLAGAVSPGQALPGGWIEAPGYRGPERRTDRERRSGRDRRNEIKAIAKNKRFGGERRKAVRRRADRIHLGLERR